MARKTHGLGGAKGHQTNEGRKNHNTQERVAKSKARKTGANARALARRSTKANTIMHWAKAEIKLANAEKKSGKIDRIAHSFRLLAVDKIVKQKLPKQRIMVGGKARVLTARERHVLGKTRTTDIQEQIYELRHYSNAESRQKIIRWEKELLKRFPKF